MEASEAEHTRRNIAKAGANSMAHRPKTQPSHRNGNP